MKRLLFAIVSVVAILATLALSTLSLNQALTSDGFSQNIALRGYVVVSQVRDGVEIYHHEDHNLITNKGRDWMAAQVGSGSGISNGTRYIALSNDGTAPANGDTSCASEITNNGLSRAQAAYAHSAGTNTWTETKVFTATGTQSVQKACLLTNPTAGSTADYLFAENTFTSASLISGDTLTITWTVTMS